MDYKSREARFSELKGHLILILVLTMAIVLRFAMTY